MTSKRLWSIEIRWDSDEIRKVCWWWKRLKKDRNVHYVWYDCSHFDSVYRRGNVGILWGCWSEIWAGSPLCHFFFNPSFIPPVFGIITSLVYKEWLSVLWRRIKQVQGNVINHCWKFLQGAGAWNVLSNLYRLIFLLLTYFLQSLLEWETIIRVFVDNNRKGMPEVCTRWKSEGKNLTNIWVRHIYRWLFFRQLFLPDIQLTQDVFYPLESTNQQD